jgi:hypothetical protein
MRWFKLTLLTLTLSAVAGAELVAALAAPADSGASGAAGAKFARLQGSFAMRGRITAGGGVPGERPGKRVRRTWKLSPTCASGQCRRERLVRHRGRVLQRLTLSRVAHGRYRVRSAFYGPLRCGGRIYQSGEQVVFVISVRVRRAVRIQQRLFATRITASYRAVSAINHTPCVAFLGRDAAVYTGHLSSPLPTPPHAGFTFSSVVTTVTFHDTSGSGRGGAPIVSWQWNFGDPASGANNVSSQPNPAHTFSAPGSYAVSLTVRDSLGLTATTQQTVTVP